MTDLHDLVAPYALDALAPDEIQQFEAHLQGCGSCQTELIEMREGAAALAGSVAKKPPPGLRTAVMTAIDDLDSDAVVEFDSDAVVDLDSRRRSRLAWAVASAAAVVALVFFGLWTVASNQLSQADQITAVYEAPDAQLMQLDSSFGPVRFIYSPGLGKGVLNGASLDDLDQADLYEIWLIGDDAPVPSGTLVGGDSAVLVEGVEPGLILALTVEPAPGSDAPTSDPILATEL